MSVSSVGILTQEKQATIINILEGMPLETLAKFTEIIQAITLANPRLTEIASKQNPTALETKELQLLIRQSNR